MKNRQINIHTNRSKAENDSTREELAYFTKLLLVY